MREILNLSAKCLIIIIVGIICKGTIENQFTTQTISHDSPMFLDEVVVVSEPTKVEPPEVPEVRFIIFEDEFAPNPIDPLVANLTEYEWAELESIAIAEAGNQDIEGIALVMWTILNRCRNTGASVHATIFAPSQFYTAGMAGGNDKSRQARELLESGWDESQGCLYFCNQGWNFYGDEHLFKHGAHWFSR